MKEVSDKYSKTGKRKTVVKPLFINLSVLLMIILFSRLGYCKSSFPWSMYLPPITSQCYTVDVAFCFHQSNCEAAGGFWYGNSCNSEISPNYTNTLQLVGEWYISITQGDEKIVLFYTFNENTIQENPEGSGEYTIKGLDGDLDIVTGGYNSALEKYTFRVAKEEVNYYYEFDFINNRDVVGCFYTIDREDETQSECYRMVGTNLSR